MSLALLRRPLVSLGSFALVILGAYLIGCQTPGVGKNAPRDHLTKAEQSKFDDYLNEVELGRNMAGRLLAFYGSNGDQSMLRYLNRVGSYVGGFSDFSDRRYMVAVLASDTINAFACPGGYILITEGALRELHNEAELAAILGHEIAHIGHRHMYDTLAAMTTKDSIEAAMKANGLSSDDAFLKVRSRPEPTETDGGAKLARYLSGSAGIGLNILKAAQAGMTLLTEQGLDRKLEFTADQEGVRFAVRAGYEPRAMIDFLSRLAKKEDQVQTLSKTHPPAASRQLKIARLLKSLRAQDIIGASGQTRFKKAIPSLR